MDKSYNETRYARQTMLPEIGTEGQARLNRASVLIVGVGGLGSAAATYLTGAGTGTIGLADNDIVELSNLQRQTLYSEAQIGMPKAEAARERLSQMSSETNFRIYPSGITAENATGIIAGYDVVVDCCDNFATRYLLDDVCSRLDKPWVYGSIGEFHGQLSVFGHKSRRRYTELYPDRTQLLAIPRQKSGVIGAVPGFIGCLQAAETIKIITGFGVVSEGRLFTIDMRDMSTGLIEF